MIVVFYTVNLYICVFMTCLYDTLIDPWYVYMHICMYVCTVHRVMASLLDPSRLSSFSPCLVV